MNNENKRRVPIVFYPITSYLFLGTTLFFALYKIERIIAALGYYSAFPGIATFSPRDWHDENILLTASFPITWPLIFIWVTLLLLYAIIASTLRSIYNTLHFIVKSISSFLDTSRSQMTDSIDNIWQDVKDIFP